MVHLGSYLSVPLLYHITRVDSLLKLNALVWLLEFNSTVMRSLDRACSLSDPSWVIVLWTCHLLPLLNVHDWECVFDWLSVQRRWWLGEFGYGDRFRNRRVGLLVTEYSDIIICLSIYLHPISNARNRTQTIREAALNRCLLRMTNLLQLCWLSNLRWAFFKVSTIANVVVWENVR